MHPPDRRFVSLQRRWVHATAVSAVLLVAIAAAVLAGTDAPPAQAGPNIPCAQWQQMHPGWPCVDVPDPPTPPPGPPSTPAPLPTQAIPGQPSTGDGGGTNAGALTPPPVGPGNGTPIVPVPGADIPVLPAQPQPAAPRPPVADSSQPPIVQQPGGTDSAARSPTSTSVLPAAPPPAQQPTVSDRCGSAARQMAAAIPAAGNCSILEPRSNVRQDRATVAPLHDVSWLPGCIGPRNSNGGCAWAHPTWDLSHDQSVKLQTAQKSATRTGFSAYCAAIVGAATVETTIGALVAAVGAFAICGVIYDLFGNNPEPLGPNDHIRLIFDNSVVPPDVTSAIVRG